MAPPVDDFFWCANNSVSRVPVTLIARSTSTLSVSDELRCRDIEDGLIDLFYVRKQLTI